MPKQFVQTAGISRCVACDRVIVDRATYFNDYEVSGLCHSCARSSDELPTEIQVVSYSDVLQAFQM